jgi:hypothetical protein
VDETACQAQGFAPAALEAVVVEDLSELEVEWWVWAWEDHEGTASQHEFVDPVADLGGEAAER